MRLPKTLTALGTVSLVVGLVYPGLSSAPASRGLSSAPGSRSLADAKSTHEPGGKPTNLSARQAYGKLPVRFEANRGQTDSQVRFVAKTVGYSLFLTRSEAVIALSRPEPPGDGPGSPPSTALSPQGSNRPSQAVLRMRPVGAVGKPVISGAGRVATKTNYFKGNDPKQWHTGIPNYKGVKYRNLYPGIDFLYSAGSGGFEYRFVLSPGSSPKDIGLAFSGQQAMSIDSAGNLVLRTALGDVRHHRPFVYQMAGGTRRSVPGRFVLEAANRVGFQLGAYDRSRTLVIDPDVSLSYSATIGGSGDADVGYAIAVDSQGQAFVTGRTNSADFPKTSSLGPDGGGSDVFVTKLSADGSAILYSAILGGSGASGNEAGFGIAVDPAGNAYVTGFSDSADFPRTRNLNPAGTGIFVAKLNADGSQLIYSNDLGPGQGRGIAVGKEPSGDYSANVTGLTDSATFPVRNALQATKKGPPSRTNAFVSRIIPTGPTLFTPHILAEAVRVLVSDPT